MTLPALPITVAIVGLVVYVLAGDPKASECGRLAFAIGLLVSVAMMAGLVLPRLS